jgi:hypothetical protein
MPKLYLTPITYCAAHKLCAPVLFVLLAVTSACAQQRSFGAEYDPFVDGSQATYNVQMTFIDGTKIKVQTIVIIKGKTLIQGKEYYKQVSTSSALDQPTRQHRIKPLFISVSLLMASTKFAVTIWTRRKCLICHCRFRLERSGARRR